MEKKPTNRPKSGQGDPWNTALRLLSGRDYSTTGLRRRLKERGYSSEQVEKTIERCDRLGYLDDQRYALNRARSLIKQGRAVGNRILLELRQQGLSDDLAQQVLEQVTAEFDEDQLLESLLARRFPNFTYIAATPSERRRVVHFLQRRGFPLDRIMTNLTRKGP